MRGGNIIIWEWPDPASGKTIRIRETHSLTHQAPHMHTKHIKFNLQPCARRRGWDLFPLYNNDFLSRLFLEWAWNFHSVSMHDNQHSINNNYPPGEWKSLASLALLKQSIRIEARSFWNKKFQHQRDFITSDT